MPAPRHSIVLVTCNHLELTARCVASLRASVGPDTELVAVDNGSTDGTVGFLEHLAGAFPGPVRVVALPENRGWCVGANQGLAVARGEFLVLLNNDVVLPRGWLDGLRTCMTQAQNHVPGLGPVGLVGPVSNAVGGEQQVPADEAVFPELGIEGAAEALRRRYPRRWEPTHFLSGFCLMMHRDCHEAVGALDERFSPGGFDDNDLVLRAQEAGFCAVVARDTFVFHQGSVTFHSLYPELRAGLANQRVFFDKWRERRAGQNRLVAIYRVKDAEATLAQSLDATARFADAVVVLDDGSSDSTPQICGDHPAVTHYERQDLPFDERRDRNRLLRLAEEQNPDWVIAVDADECFEMDRARAERLMSLCDPHVKCLGFHWYTFWEPTHCYFRADGVFGTMSGHRMFRAEPNQRIVHGTPEGLHCGNIPQFPEGARRYTGVRVRHLGYDTEQRRQEKRAFYLRVDRKPDPALVGSSDYGHLTAATVTLRRYPKRRGVALCMITRNEEERLGTMLAFFEPFVDEICVVDTGSTDATLEIASRFCAKVDRLVTPRPELDRARNRSLEMARSPWILVMDPDEEIAPGDIPRLLRLCDDEEVHAYTFVVENHQKDSPPVNTVAMRLFRNDPRIRFSRPVHETVEQSLRRLLGAVIRPSGIPIQHYGFLHNDARVEEKIQAYFQRNRAYREENPTDPVPWYNEALHHLNEGREDLGIPMLERALELDPDFLSPRAQLAFLHQDRALHLWHEVVMRAAPDHPVREQAVHTFETLRAVTPQRPRVGLARMRLRGGGGEGSDGDGA